MVVAVVCLLFYFLLTMQYISWTGVWRSNRIFYVKMITCWEKKHYHLIRNKVRWKNNGISWVKLSDKKFFGFFLIKHSLHHIETTLIFFCWYWSFCPSWNIFSFHTHIQPHTHTHTQIKRHRDTEYKTR